MTTLQETARALAAKLLPHTTSVHNVTLIAEALTAAHTAGRIDGIRQAAARGRLAQMDGKVVDEEILKLLMEPQS